MAVVITSPLARARPRADGDGASAPRRPFPAAAGGSCDAERETLPALLDSPAEDGAARLATARLEVLLEVARLNKVLHVLWRRRDAVAALAPDLLPRLDSYRVRTIAMNRRGMLLAGRVTAALDRAGIPHVHLKGPLQQLILFGDPYLKPSGDVDVLVAEPDRELAAEILGDLGYASGEPQMERWWVRHLGESHLSGADGGPVVDLHHRIRQPGAPGIEDAAPLIAAAVRLTYDGGIAPVLAPQHRCLICAIGLAKALLAHEPCGGHLVDMRAALAALAPEDARALGRESRDVGLAQTLAAARHAVARVLPGPGARGVEAPDPLAFLDDGVLRTLAVTPWAAPDRALRRRRLLWALCGGNPVRFASEARRKLASDACRRRLQRDAQRGGTAGQGA